MTFLEFFIFFSLLAFGVWLFQIITSLIYISHLKKKKTDIKDKTNISVVMAFYNEEEKEILESIQSIYDNKNINNLEIIIVNDGSTYEYKILPLRKDIIYIHYNENKGKRYALEVGIEKAKYDYIVTLDSDTFLYEDSIYNIHQDLLKTKCDAMGGNLTLLNKDETFITKLIDAMYWFAFNHERSSQSLFKCLTCCSGGFSIYKSSKLKQLLGQIYNQKVGKLRCVAGDDRHITSLFLMNGFKVGWSPNGKAQTISPSTYSRFIKQQIRWTRSMVLEITWTLLRFNKFSFIYYFFVFKNLYKYVYLLLTYFALFHILFHMGAAFTFIALLGALISFMSFLFVKCLVVFWWTKRWDMSIKTFIFGLLGYFLLSPFLLYGVVTCRKVGWLTRD